MKAAVDTWNPYVMGIPENTDEHVAVNESRDVEYNGNIRVRTIATLRPMALRGAGARWLLAANGPTLHFTVALVPSSFVTKQPGLLEHGAAGMCKERGREN